METIGTRRLKFWVTDTKKHYEGSETDNSPHSQIWNWSGYFGHVQ
jgi:hypothetical protein